MDHILPQSNTHPMLAAGHGQYRLKCNLPYKNFGLIFAALKPIGKICVPAGPKLCKVTAQFDPAASFKPQYLFFDGEPPAGIRTSYDWLFYRSQLFGLAATINLPDCPDTLSQYHYFAPIDVFEDETVALFKKPGTPHIWVEPSRVKLEMAEYHRQFKLFTLDPSLCFPDSYHYGTEDFFRFKPGARVLDMGAGTGIQGFVALKQGAHSVLAADINPAAVAISKINAQLLGYSSPRYRVIRSDLFAGVQGKFDAIIFNAPKPCPSNVANEALPPSVRNRVDSQSTLALRFFREVKNFLDPEGTICYCEYSDSILDLPATLKENGLQFFGGTHTHNIGQVIIAAT